jgi:sugar/nucleoside kinase (ribokinase family)
VGEFSTKAGGSAANTARGLAHGFDVSTGLIGAVGRGLQSSTFQLNLSRVCH